MKEKFKNMTLKRKIIFGVFAILILVVLIGIFKPKGNKVDYYSIWKSIFSNDLGTYRYVLDVRTQKAEKGKKNELQDSSLSDVQNMESTSDSESATSSAVTATGGKEFVEWTNESGTQDTDWTYPNYKIIIEGATSSVKPFTTQFSVNIATSSFNDKLTTITVKDKKVYVDVEQLQYWLKSSKDSYLIQLSKDLPENSKYLIIPESDLKLTSGYAEEAEANKVYENSALNYHHRLVSVIDSFLYEIQNGMGSTGLSSQDDVYSINLDGDNAQSLISLLGSLVVDRASVYDTVIEDQNSQGLLSKEQYQQKLREKDNFLDATKKLYDKVSTTDLSNCNLRVQGNGRSYTGGSGYANIEATLSTAFTIDGTDYSISLTGLRTGKKEDIKTPVGTSSSIEQSQVWSTFGNMLDYFNITDIDLKKRIEINPDVIKDNLLEDFVQLVNNTSSTSSRISKLNVKDFIKKYMNYKETDESTNDDKINATLVSDFLTSISDITSNLVVEKEVTGTGTSEQFVNVDGTTNGMRVIAKYDTSASNEKLGVVQLTILNMTGKPKTVDLSNFSLQTMISSKYPANSKDMILDYDNKFDVKKLKTKVKVPSKGYATETLYFVHNNGLEYMDLWYGGTKLGEIISRA